MLDSKDSVAVASRTFSSNTVLRDALLKKFPNSVFNDSGLTLAGESLAQFLDGHVAAITSLEIVDRSLLARLPKLKVLSKYGVGLDMVDLQALSDFGVLLGWTQGVNRRSVSELVVSTAIALLHKVPSAEKDLRNGVWRQYRGRQLTGRTVGIVGCGSIGKDVVDLLKPYNCRILAFDKVDYRDYFQKNGVVRTNLRALLSQSDVVTIHLPLDESTRNMLDEEHLNCLKSSSVFINYSRGGIVDEHFLYQMILSSRLEAVALDVYQREPAINHPLFEFNNGIFTPHMGGSTEEAVLAMGVAAIEGLSRAKNPLDYT